MTERQTGVNIPWGSLAVVAAFVSSTLLVQHAFQPLRPSEKDRALAQVGAELEVEARLWEDPFTASKRYEAERLTRCEKAAAAQRNAAAAAPAPSPRVALPASTGASGAAATAAGNLQDTPEAADRPKECSDLHLLRIRSPSTLLRSLDRDRNQDLTDALILVVMVPGNAFVGAEEGRRRTRYAVLAGLQAQGYVPDDAEHFGLLELRHLAPVSRHAAPWLLRLPYELLSQRPVQAAGAAGAAAAEVNTRSYQQVAVLWVDETALPQPKLDAMATVLGGLMAPPAPSARTENWVYVPSLPPSLALIGPSTSDGIRTALDGLQRAATRCAQAGAQADPAAALLALPPATPASKSAATPAPAPAATPTPAAAASAAAGAADPAGRCPGMSAQWLEGMRQLARAQLFNATATAPLAALPIPQAPGQELLVPKVFIRQRLEQITGQPVAADWDYRYTIATDDVVLGSLVQELKLRMPKRDKQRMVLVAERDSLYAQALVSQLQRRLADADADAETGPGPQGRGKLEFEPHYFFRGLDGATTFDSPDAKTSASTKDKDGGSSAPLEWPESRDQLDYLRRLAIALKDDEARNIRESGPIAAIGILANDVHDKLLVLQALHDSFPDKVFFTTDADARYVHPRTLGYTRNLVVASSLPLAFADPDVQAGAPPFRDVYQTAVFLAAQRAGCRRADDCARLVTAIHEAVAKPSVYEIGRQHAVPVAGYDHRQRAHQQHAARTGTVLPMWLLLAAALLFWPATPALRQTGAWLIGDTRADQKAEPATGPLDKTPAPGLTTDQRAPRLASASLALMHFTVLAYALGTVVEFCTPGRLGLAGIFWLTGLAAALGSGLLLARKTLVRTDTPLPLAPPWLVRGLLLALILAAATWVAWPPDSAEPCTACEPAAWLEGVSAWPSHLIHLLALSALVCILDFQWTRVRCCFERDTHWLALKPRRTGTSHRLSRHWWQHHSIAGWRRSMSLDGPDSVVMARLWREMSERAEPVARMVRLAVGYTVTVVVMLVLFLALSDRQVPEVPVRGLDHRELVRLTLYAVLLMLPLLMVAVADTTLLNHRLVQLLDRARTRYPAKTLKRFADALGGPAQSRLWQLSFPALPWQRGGGPTLAASPESATLCAPAVALAEAAPVATASPAASPTAVAPTHTPAEAAALAAAQAVAQAAADELTAAAPTSHGHTLLDNWIDVRLIGRRTAAVAPLVVGPLLIVAMLVVARSRLFDNWAITLPVALAICALLIWLVLLAVLLKLAAERARDKALRLMQADLLWLTGLGAGSLLAPLVEPFKKLIEEVRTTNHGAFAPLFEQPLFRGLMVPLGGIGSTQLFDYLLLAH